MAVLALRISMHNLTAVFSFFGTATICEIQGVASLAGTFSIIFCFIKELRRVLTVVRAGVAKIL